MTRSSVSRQYLVAHKVRPYNITLNQLTTILKDTRIAIRIKAGAKPNTQVIYAKASKGKFAGKFLVIGYYLKG